MVGGLREVDFGRVWQQGGPERPPVHFPLPRLAWKFRSRNCRFYNLAFLSTLCVGDTNSSRMEAKRIGLPS